MNDSIHMAWLTTVSPILGGGYSALFWPLLVLHTCSTQTHRQTGIYIKISNSFKKNSVSLEPNCLHLNPTLFLVGIKALNK